MGKFKLSRTSKEHLKGVKENINSLVTRSLAKSEVDFGIPPYGGLRTAQEQNNLFHQKTRVTFQDGFKNISYHQSGNAFDIYVYDEHGACWKCVEKYKAISIVIREEFELMKEEGLFAENAILRWGGDFVRPKDLPHFEVRNN